MIIISISNFIFEGFCFSYYFGKKAWIWRKMLRENWWQILPVIIEENHCCWVSHEKWFVPELGAIIFWSSSGLDSSKSEVKNFATYLNQRLCICSCFLFTFWLPFLGGPVTWGPAHELDCRDKSSFQFKGFGSTYLLSISTELGSGPE